MELVPSALHVTLTALDFSGSLFSRTALVPVRENNFLKNQEGTNGKKKDAENIMNTI